MMHNKITGRDIVLFSFQAWDSNISFNFRDMAFELAKNNRILFVDRALDRNTAIRNGKMPAGKRGTDDGHISLIQENFWLLRPSAIMESGSWAPFYGLFDFFNRINNKRLGREISDTIEELGLEDVILINDNDFFRGLYLKDLIPNERYIFYIRDFLTIQSFFKKYGPRCEHEMFAKADMVVANSAYLAGYAAKWNPNSVDIGQGCDLQAFVVPDREIPAELKALPRPIIGYCGAITDMRLDFGVVTHLAETFPAYSVVMVGFSDPEFDRSRFAGFKNLYFLGGKPPGETPNYIAHFDICLNPQAVNPLTIGNYPRKIDEYLAAGKAVVATRTHAMEMFSDHCFLCDSREDYVAQVRKILSDPALRSREIAEDRRAFALEHTWENSMGVLSEAYLQSEPSLQLA